MSGGHTLNFSAFSALLTRLELLVMHKCPENSAQQNLKNFKTAFQSIFSPKKLIFKLLTHLPNGQFTFLRILWISYNFINRFNELFCLSGAIFRPELSEGKKQQRYQKRQQNLTFALLCGVFQNFPVFNETGTKVTLILAVDRSKNCVDFLIKVWPLIFRNGKWISSFWLCKQRLAWH